MKIALSDVGSGYNLQNINANFEAIALALNEYVLWRNNPAGEPNTLETSLDANGKIIYNLPEPVFSSQAARLQDVRNAILGNSSANLISFTPTGTITSETVQAAIAELALEIGGVTNLSPPGTMAGIGGGLQIVNSVSALRAVSKTSPASKALVLGYAAPGDGGNGVFYVDLVDTLSVDNGSSVIVGTDGGRWKLVQNHNMSLTQFGTNFSVAMTAAVAKKGTFHIPAGTYLYTAPVVVDYSANAFPSEYTMGARLSLRGDSVHSTKLNYNGSPGTFALRLLGSVIPGTFGIHAYDSYSDFTIHDSTGSKTRNGIYSENRAFFELNRISFNELNVGLQMNATLSSTFEKLQFNYNNIGTVLDNTTGFSLPNALNFYNCAWNACFNLAVAGNVVGATNRFEHCRVEHNGAAGSSSTGGIFLNLSGLNGTAGVVFDNCYFEGNGGLADVSLTGVTPHHMTVVFRNCTFNRLDSVKYTTNNIRAGSTGGGTLRIVLEGCSFLSTNSYVPSAARPFFHFDSSIEMIDVGCTYSEATSLGTTGINMPTSGVTLGGRVNADGTSAMSTNGTVTTKVGVGVYTVNRAGGGFSRTAAGFVPMAVCNFNGGGRKVERVHIDSSNQFTVVITDNAGALQDAGFHWTATRLG